MSYADYKNGERGGQSSNPPVQRNFPQHLGFSYQNDISSELKKKLEKKWGGDITRFFTDFAIIYKNTPKLARCTTASITGSLKQLINYGLLPTNNNAYFIPYGSKNSPTFTCKLTVSYIGLMEILKRDPNIVDVRAAVVRPHDECVIDLASPEKVIKHIPSWEEEMEYYEDTGLQIPKIFGAYCLITFKDRPNKVIERMTKKDIYNCMKLTKFNLTESSAWIRWFTEMARKSVIRRALKKIDLNSICEKVKRQVMEICAKDDEDVIDATPEKSSDEELMDILEQEDDNEEENNIHQEENEVVDNYKNEIHQYQ